MRPIHSLFVVIALAALAAVCWLALGGDDARPEVAGVAPAPTRAVVPTEPEVALTDPGELTLTETLTPARVAIEEPAPAVAAAERAPGPRLVGQVRDPAGNALAGARVIAATSDGVGFEQPLDAGGAAPWRRLREATTDDAGRFELEGLRAGGVRLAVRAAGFAPHDADSIALPAGGAHELEPIVMQPSVILSGRVVTQAGHGVSGATLVRVDEHRSGIVLGGGFSRQGAELATTAADGSFLIDQLASGRFAIRVAHEDHPDLVEAGKTYAAGERVDGLTIVMERGYQIHGRVAGVPAGGTDELYVLASPDFEEDGGRVAFKTLRGSDGSLAVESREVDLASDGSFVLRGLREGQRYSLSARRNRGNRGLAYMFSTSLSPRVFADAGDRGVELEYQPAGAFVFQVVDAKTSVPITEYQIEGGTNWMSVQRGDDGRKARQHPEGRGRYGDLRPKDDDVTYKLRVRAVGYREQLLTGLSVHAGQEFDLGIIALEAVPLVRVTVTDGESGEPVSGARVSLSTAESGGGSFSVEHTMNIDIGGDEDDVGGPQITLGGDGTQTALTDEDGLAVLTSQSGTSSVLNISHRDFAPHAGEPFTIAGDSHHDVTVPLGRGGSVTVALLTTSGAPLAGARVEHRAPGQDGLAARFSSSAHGANVTDAEGRVTFAHLAPGAHSFGPQQAADGFAFSSNGRESTFRVRRSGTQEPTLEPGWEQVLVSEGSSAEIALIAPVRVQVAGRVYEEGEPLEGALVSLVDARSADRDPMMSMFGGPSGPEARTDAKGAYTLENVNSGEYTVRVTHPERHMPTELPLLLGEEDRLLNIDLTVTMVEGRVTGDDGSPLEGVRIWPEAVKDDGGAPRAMMIAVMVVDDGGGAGGDVVTMSDGNLGGARTLTDSNGDYSLRGIRDGVEIVIKAEGGAVKPGSSEVLSLAAGELQQNVDIVLGAAGKIEVVARLADGTPASSMIVIAAWDGPGEDDVERKTGFIQSGSTTLDGLTPGPWRVEVRGVTGLGGGEEGGIPDQSIQVVAGETALAEFQVP